MKNFVIPGKYRHYKGGEYRVIGTARHTETEEYLVLYVPLYGEPQEKLYWVRPLDMFNESVDVDGQSTPRFTLVEADERLH